MTQINNQYKRRRFLTYLASTPLLGKSFRAVGQSPSEEISIPIDNAEEAVNVFDFETVARTTLSNAHYTYLSSGVDSGETIKANRAGFEKIQLRVRRMIDVSEVDTSIKLFGKSFSSPIVVAPCGTQKAFHPDGELATARASNSRDTLQILSTVSSYSVEEVNGSRHEPTWFQLYPTEDWNVTRQLVQRATNAGCPAIAVTVDLPASNREALRRFRRDTNMECLGCHIPGFSNSIQRRPMFDGIDTSSITTTRSSNLDWEFMDKLRDFTDAKLLLKGIVTSEDAELCIEHGVDGVIVSNHGGRAENSGRGTIESLPEVVRAVRGRIPVLVDSGFRRGVDIFKAFALGADAVCIGRPYLWGLSSYGQTGVEKVLDLLHSELKMMMQQAGTKQLSDINNNYIA
ncbi:MAG: alpha-hydroxy-acid oxidizing enzyme [Rhodospirillaceae bacterium]|nr:alpha-hydroxy-acid oxidizing enzyme [Rhodospirillaceae bacterium]|tara:strand:+ start:3214 stop:4416 length:1203 start_codon:yes stop_codon:yes gene_type:complete